MRKLCKNLCNKQLLCLWSSFLYNVHASDDISWHCFWAYRSSRGLILFSLRDGFFSLHLHPLSVGFLLQFLKMSDKNKCGHIHYDVNGRGYVPSKLDYRSLVIHVYVVYTKMKNQHLRWGKSLLLFWLNFQCFFLIWY